MAINREYYPTIAVLALTILFGLVYYTSASLLLRVPIGLLFLIFVPGYSIIQLIDLKDDVQKIVLSIALSIAIETIISWLVIYSELWSINLIVNILIFIVLGCTVIYFFWIKPIGTMLIRS